MSDPVADEIIELNPTPVPAGAEPAIVDPRVFDRDFDGPDSEPDSQTAETSASPTNLDSSQATAERIKPCDVTLRMSFLDPSGHAIEGLGYRIVAGNTTNNGSTDSQGKCAPLSGLLPGSSLEILIRKDDGSYVSKYNGEVLAGDMEMCGISPWIKIPITTEEHHGTPANPPATSPKPSTPQLPAAVNAKPAVAARPPVDQKPSGGKKPDVQPQSCRTDQGHPRARLTERFVDWADQHGVPTFGLWSWKKLVEQPSSNATSCPSTDSSPQSAPAKPGAATSAAPPSGKGSAPTRNTPGQTSNTTPPPLPTAVTTANQAAPQQVLDLIGVMDEQVKWPWKSLASAGEIVSRIKVKTFVWPTEFKSETQSDHRCYKSVKVGLWRAGYVRAVNEDIPAYTAGRWLLNQGFKDVTQELPDARWAWPGDVIVYQYPEAKRATNDAAAKEAYQKRLKAYEQKRDAAQKGHDEWSAAKKNFDSSKAEWEKANPGKRYTKKFGKPEPKMPPLPVGPEDTNYGHIDVRTYEGYSSDFESTTLPKPSGFIPIGVYRKVSDPLPDLRLRAFLKVIRDWETADIPDDKKYYCVYSGNGPKKYAESVQGHPFSSQPKSDHTPSGAYQITLETYLDLCQRLGFPDSFLPIAQDRMAVAIIESVQQNPLGKIRMGNIADAATALKGRWSSLPGGKHTKGDMAKFIAAFNANLSLLIK